jgi:hypothetical protein
LLQQASLHGAESTESRETFSVHILLEHAKAGKAIGTKGSIMQVIKGKSLVNSLKMEKEPKVNGLL